jgi:hypothetical protein
MTTTSVATVITIPALRAIGPEFYQLSFEGWATLEHCLGNQTFGSQAKSNSITDERYKTSCCRYSLFKKKGGPDFNRGPSFNLGP